MDTHVWSNVTNKLAHILVLRGHEVTYLKVSGNMLTMKRNLSKVMEALARDVPPAESGGKVVETIDARSITKAVIGPGDVSLTLHAEGGAPRKIEYGSAEKDASGILRAIVGRSGRSFSESEENVGLFEAIVGPGFIGFFAGLFWAGIYSMAAQLARGEPVEINGRRQGLKRIMLWVAENIGVNGAIAVGVLLLVVIGGWIAMQVIKRPKRNVWRPEGDPEAA